MINTSGRGGRCQQRDRGKETGNQYGSRKDHIQTILKYNFEREWSLLSVDLECKRRKKKNERGSDTFPPDFIQEASVIDG
jgi:hypothetical protein